MKTRQKTTPVIEYNFYLGVLTEKGLVAGLEAEKIFDLVVKFVRTDIEPARLSDRVVEIQSRLSDEVDILPVVEDGKYLGAITSQDINRIYSFKLKEPAAQEAG